MSIEKPILYKQIRQEFNIALSNANDGEFIERPKSLSRLARQRKEFVKEARSNIQETKQELFKESELLCNQYRIDRLLAMDLILRAWDIEERLLEEGVIFGELPFNFTIDRIGMEPTEEQQVVDSSTNAMRALKLLAGPQSSSLFPELPMNPVEQEFENLKLTPNAARIDIIQTEDGPKIIEINSQWVDAIAALAGFLKVYGQARKGTHLIKTFARALPNKAKLAIINIPQTTGSKAMGAALELEKLAELLLKTGRVEQCEVLNPAKTSLDYLRTFNVFYTNCDPKAFNFSQPSWIRLVAQRASQNPTAIYPSWRPLLDKKFALSLLSNPNEQLALKFAAAGVNLDLLRKTITPTTPLIDSQKINSSSDVVVKGDGYSLNSVVTSKDPNFGQFLEYAMEEPEAYVVQPFLETRRFDAWVYDSGTRKVKLLKNAYSKLNVWYLNDKIVGMLSTISDSPLISDRGFNSPPLLKKERRQNEKSCTL